MKLRPSSCEIPGNLRQRNGAPEMMRTYGMDRAGIAGSAAWIAQVLFVVFLVLFVISLIFRRRPPLV